MSEKAGGKLKADKKPPEIELYFDERDGAYWYPLKGRYVKLKASDLKMHLRTRGLRENEWFDGLRELDWPLWNAQMKHMVSFAGPLAGHPKGTFNHGGRKILVTEEADDIFANVKKRAPSPKWFLKFVQEVLPDEQWLFYCHWLRIALEAMRERAFTPGQAVVLAGRPGCGKSLLQYTTTEIFGGRSADPFEYMMSETKFNWDMVGAEHWMIEDPKSSTHIAVRRLFGAKLKEATVNMNYSISQKTKDKLFLPLFRRVTISINDEPENLSVIPPLDGSIADKMFLFKCGVADVGENRKATWETMIAELPLIRSWLLHRLPKLPAQFKDARFKIKAWHHPDLLEELSSMSPESRLLLLIDHILFERAKPEDRDTAFVGKSLDLEKELLRDNSLRWQVEKLLSFSSACGTYLARLEKMAPDRISSRKKQGVAIWTILPPSEPKDDQ